MKHEHHHRKQEHLIKVVLLGYRQQIMYIAAQNVVFILYTILFIQQSLNERCGRVRLFPTIPCKGSCPLNLPNAHLLYASSKMDAKRSAKLQCIAVVRQIWHRSHRRTHRVCRVCNSLPYKTSNTQTYIYIVTVFGALGSV